MAKPVLVATITQDNSNVATIIREASDGMRWITTKVKVGHPTLRIALSFSQVKNNLAHVAPSKHYGRVNNTRQPRHRIPPATG